VAGEEDSEQLGIEGARGINQVLVEAATVKKINANGLFKAGAYKEAREAYLKALGYLSQLSHRTEDEDEVVKQAKAVRVALLLNVAACDLKRIQYSAVIENCNRVLDMDAENHKAKYRRGVAYSYLGRLEEAMADLRFVLHATETADTGTLRDIRREIDRVKALMGEKKEEEKSMAIRMLGGSTIGRKELLGELSQS
jgi:peptidyl-prolyl isomerase D